MSETLLQQACMNCGNSCAADLCIDCERADRKSTVDNVGAEFSAPAAVRDSEPMPSGWGFGYIATDLTNVTARRVSWHLDKFVPMGIPTVLAAPGGTGKGLWLLHVIAHHMEDKVLYLGSEDNLELVVKPRAEAAGVPPERFMRLRGSDENGNERQLRFPSDAPLLERAIVAEGAGLVVIDAGVEHLEEGLRSNAAEDVRRFMSALNDVCERQGVSLIVVLHTNKTREAHGSDRVAGSRTWVDAARHVLLAARDDEDENLRHVEVVKTNISILGYGRQYRIATSPVRVLDYDGEWIDEEIPYLEDAGESDKPVEKLLAEAGKSKIVDIGRAILTYLEEASKPMDADTVDLTVSAEVGRSQRTVRDKRLKLNRDGLAESVQVCDATGKVVAWRAAITEKGRKHLATLEARVAPEGEGGGGETENGLDKPNEPQGRATVVPAHIYDSGLREEPEALLPGTTTVGATVASPRADKSNERKRRALETYRATQGAKLTDEDFVDHVWAAGELGLASPEQLSEVLDARQKLIAANVPEGEVSPERRREVERIFEEMEIALPGANSGVAA